MPCKFLLIAFFIFLLTTCGEQVPFNKYKNGGGHCPHLFKKVFKGFVPRGNTSAGVFEDVPEAKNLGSCIVKCCYSKLCNVVFMGNKKCYHIQCVSNEICAPKLYIPQGEDDSNDVEMVLVRPVGEESWGDVLSDDKGQTADKDVSNTFFNPSDIEQIYQDALMESDEPNYKYRAETSCNVGIPDSCYDEEECIRNHPTSRAGTCECKPGYSRTMNGRCTLVLELDSDGIHEPDEEFSEKIIPLQTSTNVPLENLFVTVESKVVKLPENEVTLTAKVDPLPYKGEGYQFEWNLIQYPEGNAALKDQNLNHLHLAQLSEGLYTFKVSASNGASYGEGFANVTVLPPSRVNRPPIVIITPIQQNVKLPNTGAVLDGSASYDDDGIINWHWDLVQGPLGYEPELQEASTLQLKDLKIPGNYTFKLTVTDTDKAINSSTANITVVKVTDYPPEANAGQDEIIYLPHNSITLNGNLSSDDHAIVAWEWTKSPGDANKAVDMQDTRTPYLKLSDLEEGVYTFVLKVTDSDGKISSSEVHVFVKPPTNQPPSAEAGDNVTISLPQVWAVLDASKSTDDNKIVDYKWEQESGPSQVTFDSLNSSITNVTGLTKGTYRFKILVTDDNGNVANDTTFIIVNQNENQVPTANAGGDFVVELPRNIIYVNGSLSTDDWKVSKWKWKRHESSLAIGNIAENSDDTPILMLTDVIPGKYVFTLTVWDEQGQSDSDMVTITVKSDSMLYHIVDITIGTDAQALTQSQYNIAKGKLALLVQNGAVIKERYLKPEPGTNKAVLSFYVEDMHGKPLPATEVVDQLRKKLRIDESLLGFSVEHLQTAVCQNNCSEHGVCNELTRKCVCEAFWMQDLFNLYFGYEEDSDCKWSVLYVVLGVICGFVALIGVLWGAAYLCFGWCVRRRLNSKPSFYKLITETDDLSFSRRDLSETDTDSDVVFESKSKNSRFETRNAYKTARNGFSKMGKRIKT